MANLALKSCEYLTMYIRSSLGYCYSSCYNPPSKSTTAEQSTREAEQGVRELWGSRAGRTSEALGGERPCAEVSRAPLAATRLRVRGVRAERSPAQPAGGAQRGGEPGPGPPGSRQPDGQPGGPPHVPHTTPSPRAPPLRKSPPLRSLHRDFGGKPVAAHTPARQAGRAGSLVQGGGGPSPIPPGRPSAALGGPGSGGR